MFKKTMAILLTVSFMFPAHNASLAETDRAGTHKYGALYTGEYDDADADRFVELFKSIGWKEEVWKTSNSITNYPSHYDFTRGYNNAYTRAGADADILYISGHGWEDTTIPIYRLNSRLVYRISDDISPDTTTTSDSTWEVGVDWNGLFPDNESRWDKDLEWVIISACSQLNTLQDGPAVYPESKPTNSAAKAWARTMLARGARVHGIFGYRRTAPAGDADTAVIEKFFYNAASPFPSTVLDSWIAANTLPSTNWAAVVHHANEGDFLHGFGSGAKADTTGSYRIDYFSGNTSYYNRRILDGRGGSYEEMGTSPAFFERVIRLAKELLYPKSVIAKENEDEFEIADVEFTVGEDAAKQMEFTGLKMDALEIERDLENEEETLESFKQEMEDVEEIEEDDGSIVYKDAKGKSSVRHHPSGAIVFDDGEDLEDKPVKLSKKESIKEAENFIADHGGLPEDAEVTMVSTVERIELDLIGDNDGETETIEYQILFSRKIDEALSTDGAEGIQVTVGATGPNRMYKLWHDIEPVDTTPNQEIIDAKDALESFKEYVNEVWVIDGLKNPKISDINLVYYLKDSEKDKGEIVPAWRILTDGNMPVYIDAYTGKKAE